MTFKEYLLKEDLSMNTIDVYLRTIKEYLRMFNNFNQKQLLAYKEYLMNNNKPKTINLKIIAINKYLKYKNMSDISIKTIKLQRSNYLDNVISKSDYLFLVNKLKKDNIKWYFIIRYLGSTGARVSELIKFKIEDLDNEYFEVYSKGQKIRRIYIPNKLVKETKEWLVKDNRDSGYLFLNRNNKALTTRGIYEMLKWFARKYQMNEKVIYPHSFRHMYAKEFLNKYKDLALLADLLGHDSIETTKIYLRQTTREQQNIINKVVNW